MHVLLIEDDMDLGAALLAALKLHGFSCEWLRRTTDASIRIDDGLVDCVLLDLNLPGGSGFDLLFRWRKSGSAAPVIVITARADLEDRLAGLDGGADDFLVKPFATEELLSRIRAVVRRYAQNASEVWSFGDLSVEPKAHVARLHGATLDLSPREFQLLLELCREPGVVVPKSLLAQRMEPLGEPLLYSTIEMHIFNLRRTIGAGRIRTVRGVGYSLVI